jgi:hypothetical protein
VLLVALAAFEASKALTAQRMDRHGGGSAGFENRDALLGLVEPEMYIRAAALT